jgi:hypothetical protein
VNWDEVYPGIGNFIPKYHIQLLARFNEATLYANSGNSWKIDKYDRRRHYEISTLSYRRLTHLIELEDGRCIAYLLVSDTCWIVLGKPTQCPDTYFRSFNKFQFEDVVIIAEGIPQLFERIFQAKGLYYFDAPGFIPNNNLNNLISR